MSDEKKVEPKMEYRLLGGTGLKVSVLGFGFFATFGVKEDGKDRLKVGVKNCLPVLRRCREHGINFFDTAETYGKEYGDAEIIMGEAMEILRKEDANLWRRSDLVISTKIFWGGKGHNEKGLSKKHIIEGMNKCLERLKLTYVDVVFCHRFDMLTSIKEVVIGMNILLQKGQAFYWGTSEWTAQQITEAYWIAKSLNLEPPCVEQCNYNLFFRERMEKEYSPLFNNTHVPYNIGTTTWGCLCRGWLTGKYNAKIPQGSRLTFYKSMATNYEKLQKERVPKINALAKFAKDKYNTTSTVLSIAWVCKNKNVSVCLLGSSNLKQLNENLQAFNLAKLLTNDDMKAIENIFQNNPEQPKPWGRFLTKYIAPIN